MRIRALVLAAALASPVVAHAQSAPTVTYTVSGSSGDWFLNFSVNNQFAPPSNQVLYFFGAMLSTGRDIVGSPVNWNPDSWQSWNNVSYGGSSTTYNNVWIANGVLNGIGAGASLNGFVAHSTAVEAPTSVQWFAFTAGTDPYTGSDSFRNGTNPGFEGVATLPVTATPEPASLALMATGFAGIGGISISRRRRRTATS
jgi:hypothetical protein